MPIYDFSCPSCGVTVEMVVSASATPPCPQCGEPLTKHMGLPAPVAKTPGKLAKFRQKAAREGHFSNYSSSETRGKL